MWKPTAWLFGVIALVGLLWVILPPFLGIERAGPLWWMGFVLLAAGAAVGLFVTGASVWGIVGPGAIRAATFDAIQARRHDARIMVAFLPRGHRHISTGSADRVILPGRLIMALDPQNWQFWGPQSEEPLLDVAWPDLTDIRRRTVVLERHRGGAVTLIGVEVAFRSGDTLVFWPTAGKTSNARSLTRSELDVFIDEMREIASLRPER